MKSHRREIKHDVFASWMISWCFCLLNGFMMFWSLGWLHDVFLHLGWPFVFFVSWMTYDVLVLSRVALWCFLFLGWFHERQKLYNVIREIKTSRSHPRDKKKIMKSYGRQKTWSHPRGKRHMKSPKRQKLHKSSKRQNIMMAWKRQKIHHDVIQERGTSWSNPRGKNIMKSSKSKNIMMSSKEHKHQDVI